VSLSTAQAVYVVSLLSSGLPEGCVCVASIPPIGPPGMRLLCGDKATRSIGAIDLCEDHYLEAAAWREQLPEDARLADIAARRERELENIQREAEHRAVVEQRKREISIIYYLRRSGGDIKIGTTCRPVHRISALTREHGALQLLLTHSGGRQRERQLHDRFDDLAVGGEWFTARKRLTDWIKKCRLDPALAAGQLPRTAGMDVIREVAREGNCASRAAGRAVREQIERETALAMELICSGNLPPLGVAAAG
jgi:hypothetical protein